jgi:hypothetical protein
MTIDSCSGKGDVNRHGAALFMLKAFSNDSKSQSFNLNHSHIGTFSISKNSRQLNNFRKPAPILFLFVLNVEIHRTSEGLLMAFCPFNPFGAIRGVPLLSITAFNGMGEYRRYKGGQASFCLPTIFLGWRSVPRGQTIKPFARPTWLAIVVGCADGGGASFANDGLRKLSPSYGPASSTLNVNVFIVAFFFVYLFRLIP